LQPDAPLRPLAFFRDGRRSLAKRLLVSVTDPAAGYTSANDAAQPTTALSEAEEAALTVLQEKALKLFAAEAAARKEHGETSRRVQHSHHKHCSSGLACIHATLTRRSSPSFELHIYF
jgi:hypothetical protein